MTLKETLRRAKIAILDDGVVTLGETSVLLRMIRPFVLQGDAGAIALEGILRKVRADGIVTPEESDRIAWELEKLSTQEVTLATYVREIRDFPKPGVLFRDVTGILDTPESFNLALAMIGKALETTPFDVVVAPESRGFIFGAAIAAKFAKAFVPVRKPGKLPRETIFEEYDLEYGRAELHIHADSIEPGERVVIVDDLLATGGTAAAAARLVERLGGVVVKMVFPIELEGFAARANTLCDYDVVSLVAYPGR